MSFRDPAWDVPTRMDGLPYTNWKRRTGSTNLARSVDAFPGKQCRPDQRVKCGGDFDWDCAPEKYLYRLARRTTSCVKFVCEERQFELGLQCQQLLNPQLP